MIELLIRLFGAIAPALSWIAAFVAAVVACARSTSASHWWPHCPPKRQT